MAGVVFGAAGALARTPGRLRIAALAMPAAVLFAEAVVQVRRIDDPAYRSSDQLWSTAVLVSLGVAITLLVAARGPSERWRC